jgi:hypothetical protein
MKKLLLIFVTLAGFIFFPGCQEETEVIPGDEKGHLLIKITDDPFDIDLVESANVTISKIEIRKKGSEDDSSFIVISENQFTMDLLKLRNGVVEELAEAEIPAGSYDLVRLYVSQAELRIKDHPSPFTLKVPSGEQTGIKVFIRPSLVVEGGLTSELLLDIDLSKSFVMRGNLHSSAGINGFIFKPSVRAVNLTYAGRIDGFVTDTAKNVISNAKVWLVQDSVLATAFSDTTGFYSIIGVPSGTYSLYAYRENYDTARINSILVLPGNRTVQNLILTEQ